MLVSQYIYTACGKDRNGAFSVFSKSKDITEEESSEIREVMMYKTPSGLPFEPTEHEIEEKFPKKFGYFFLSSGRVCLAQVCYVGRVYSDLDTRWGNYIIHAFVFDKNIDFAPYSFIEHSKFRRELSRKEWHDDEIPDDLEKVEIPENGGLLSNEEIHSFFNEDRKIKLKQLIEAIISSTNDNAVTLNDDPKNHKYWFKILNLCLPKKLQNEISFCSHFTNTLVPGNISSRIQIRINRIVSAQFNYAQEAQKGRYVFDFIQNIMPTVLTVGKYGNYVVNLLSTGLFEVVKYVNEINGILLSYSVKISEASNMLNLKRADYSSFVNVDEIIETIMIVDREGYEKQIIANNLWIKKPQYKFNENQMLFVYSFIYSNISDIKIKIEIVRMILDNINQFGISTCGAVAFNDDIKSKVKFLFENYIDYVKSVGLSAYIIQNQNSFNKLYMLFDYLVNIPAVKKSLQTCNFNSLEEVISIKNIIEITFRKQSLSDIDLLMKSANSSINNSGIELLAIIVQDIINNGKSISDNQFSFEILRRVNQKREFAFNYLLYLIKINSGTEEFLKIYINSEDNERNFFNVFENEKKQLLIEFCKKKDAYRFMNQPLNIKSIKEYFEKYYIKGSDTGVFVIRLGEYLYSIQQEKRINECITLIDTFKYPSDINKSLIIAINNVILEAIFSLKYEIIDDLLLRKPDIFNRIKDTYFTIINNGGNSKQHIIEVINISLCGQILLKYDFKENNQNIISFFSKPNEDAIKIAAYMEKIQTSKSIDTFIDYYFMQIVNIFIFGATIGQYDYNGVLEKAFGKIIEKGNIEKLTDIIISGMKQTRTNSIMFILFIFRKYLALNKNNLDKKYGEISEKYFEKISSGDRKKIFIGLIEKANEKEVQQFEKYFDEFNKKHKSGFFDSLFGKK